MEMIKLEDIKNLQGKDRIVQEFLDLVDRGLIKVKDYDFED